MATITEEIGKKGKKKERSISFLVCVVISFLILDAKSKISLY
jgi:hypothetical protein